MLLQKKPNILLLTVQIVFGLFRANLSLTE